jgi:hypothetical protein
VRKDAALAGRRHEAGRDFVVGLWCRPRPGMPTEHTIRRRSGGGRAAGRAAPLREAAVLVALPAAAVGPRSLVALRP